MYSIPQHAVTKGYWKIENFRAHPIASSRRLVKNEGLLVISLPLQGAVVPGVNEARHQDPQKDPHLDQAGEPQRAVDHGPWIEEDELDVEQDEQDRGEIELDRQPPYGEGEGLLSALERRQLCGGGMLLSQRRAQKHHQRRDACGQNETHGKPDVFAHKAMTPRPVYACAKAKGKRQKWAEWADVQARR